MISVRIVSGDIKFFSNSDHTSLPEVLIEKVESWYPPPALYVKTLKVVLKDYIQKSRRMPIKKS